MQIESTMIEAHIYREIEGNIEFLLLKRSEKEIFPNLWQMVSGSIEKGEKAFETALREIKEETGIIPEKLWVLPNINSFYSPNADKIIFLPVFLSKAKSDSQVIISDEHTEYGWYVPERARELLSWPGQKKSIDIILNFLTNDETFLGLSEINIR